MSCAAGRSRREISSSSASSFVPLQPKHRPPRGEISRESVPMGRTDGSLFSIATPESSHAVKILDDNWLWNSRGNEVHNIHNLSSLGGVCSLCCVLVGWCVLIG